MRRILRITVYRIKCNYCDCEFEYDKSETHDFWEDGYKITIVDCPCCKKMLRHQDSSKSTTSMEREETMST